MDPISTIGLLASICTLARASKEVVSLLRTLKDEDAADEVARLIALVTFFEENLRGVERIFRSSSSSSSGKPTPIAHRVSVETVNDAVHESAATLRDLGARLEQLSRCENAAVRRIRWVQHRSGLLRVEERIRAQGAMLHGFVSLAQTEMILSVCGQNRQSLEVCSEMPLLEATSNDEIASAYKKEEKEEDDEEEGLIVADSGSISSSSRRTSSSIFSSSASSATANSSALSIDLDSHDGINDASVYETERDENSRFSPALPGQLVIRRSCRFDCYCQCHTQHHDVEEEGSSTSARLFRPRTLRRRKVECTEPDCAEAATSPPTAVLPSTLFKRAIAQLVSFQSLRTNYCLNNYRMVPEGAIAMRYVKHGNLEKLKLLMRSGEATPWDTAPDGWSLLHTAVYAGQLPTVKYLCEIGVDTEVADLGARKPVDLAILKSLTADATKVEHEIVRTFSRDNDWLIDFEFTPVHIAVLDLYDPADSERPSLEALIEFVDDANNASPGTDWVKWKNKLRRRSPLYMQVLEQFRVSAAAEHNRSYKVIHNLLDQKDRKLHWTPLHWASATNRADKMRTLIRHGADPFVQSNLDFNIVHAAVESNALSSLEFARDVWQRHPRGASIDQPNVWGESPLIMAAQGCRVDCVRLLLDAGADRSVRQENGQVALHYAGLSQPGQARRETVSLLVRGDAESNNSSSSEDWQEQDQRLRSSAQHVNAQDEDGRPPLLDFLDDPACVKMLVRRGGARLDLFDHCGRNVFHHVCIQNEDSQRELLQTLLRLVPASTTTTTTITTTSLLRRKDNEGNTPLMHALRHGGTEYAKAIFQLSASSSSSSSLNANPSINDDDDIIGDAICHEGWSAAHYAAKLGDAELLGQTLAHPSFVRGMRTAEGKSVQEVAMENGNWCGRIKELVRRYNNYVPVLM